MMMVYVSTKLDDKNTTAMTDTDNNIRNDNNNNNMMRAPVSLSCSIRSLWQAAL